MIRRALQADVSAVSDIYEAIHTEEEQGRAVIGWTRGIYPTLDDAQEAFDAGELYVLEDGGQVVAAGRINKRQMPAYANVDWSFPAEDDEVLVLHTLVVSPLHSGHGCARRFAAFYNDMAKELGCRALRIDTNVRNARARRLYASLGFREAGIVPCNFNGLPNIDLVCLEKRVE